jgi:hypothetical protein
MVGMTRDEWKAICQDMTRRVKRRIMFHVSVAEGFDDKGEYKRAGFTFRLSPVERAIKLATQKGRQRRLARAAARLDESGAGTE